MLFNPLLVTNYFCWRAVIKDEEGNRKVQFTRCGDRRIRELATHFLLRETLLVVHCVFHSAQSARINSDCFSCEKKCHVHGETADAS